MAANSATTSYLLGNLHCPSCVAAIKDVLLSAYSHKIQWVSPNVVTSVVTVEHLDDSASFVRSIGKTLEDAGFEICGIDTTASVPDDISDHFEHSELGESSQSMANAGTLDVWSRLWRNRRPPSTSRSIKEAAHMSNCDACQTSKAHCHDAPRDEKFPVVRAASLTSTTHELESLSDLKGVVTDVHLPNFWRASLSIGGMTCAVCVNTITAEVDKFPWISKIVVNLVSNSATVDFQGQDRAQELVEAIEDLGYDAVIDTVVDLGEEKKPVTSREVEIKVDGIFCPRCPERICRTLNSFSSSSRIDILQEPTVARPFVKIRYTPRAPEFTIRHVLRAIEATDPSLSASIYHPPTLEERSRAIRAKHQRELMWREILTFTMAVPTFVLGIVYMSLVPDSNATKHHLMKPWTNGLSRLEVILCLLATPVYFFAADIFHVRAIKELRALWRRGSRVPVLARFYRFGSMNMLMSLGTSIAYLSSVAEMIAGAASGEKDVPESRFYFDSVVFLTLFLLGGRLIEAYSKSKTGDAVEALGKLRPSTALLIEQDKLQGQTTTTVDIDQLEFGDIIRVPHGASPAADGIIVLGESNFDESSLTGESRPIKKSEGDEVFAGTVNKASAVTIRVTGASGRSMLDQIVEVVREGQTKRAPVEAIADVMTTYFVPVITLIALITWAVWMGLALSGRVSGDELGSSGGAVAFAFQFAIAVFVVACPCGLALAAPTAIFVGGGIAAQHGILAKGGGEAFEKASKIDCVVFDKTGTITEGGDPKITDSVMFPDGAIQGLDSVALLSGLKAVEEQSSHPIAKAIVGFCGSDVPAAEVTGVDEIPGKGMRASYQHGELEIAVGNESLMRDLSAPLTEHVVGMLQSWKAEAKSVALVAAKPRDGAAWSVAAILSISDPIRPEAAAVIKGLQARGTQVWMLSGDNEITAKAVAQQVGIEPTNVLAEVLPSEKADKIKYLQSALSDSTGSRRAMVAMVGDGINDSPALTTADVGIAIGSGSDVAISSADFVLATSSLTAVLTLLELSRTVLRRIKTNFGWAVVYNLLAVPISAGCLYAVKTSNGSHVRLDPVWASLAMALSSISVVLSSLSLRSKVPFLGFKASRVVE